MAQRKSGVSGYIEGVKLSAFIIALISAFPMSLLALVMIAIRISYDQPKGVDLWLNWLFIFIVPLLFLALTILHFELVKSVIFRWIVFVVSLLTTIFILGTGIYGLITDFGDFIIYVIFAVFGGSTSLCFALTFMPQSRIDDILNK